MLSSPLGIGNFCWVVPDRWRGFSIYNIMVYDVIKVTILFETEWNLQLITLTCMSDVIATVK